LRRARRSHAIIMQWILVLHTAILEFRLMRL
jgi:hypothetical protein